jgi:hypothetical protein
MSQDPTKTEAPLDLAPYKISDSAFWTTQDRGADPLATQLIGDYNGLLVDAPKRVFTDLRKTLPAGIYHHGSARGLAHVSFVKLGALVLASATENRIYAATGRAVAVDNPHRGRKAVDPDSIGDAAMSIAYSAELRSCMNLPWRAGHFVLMAILRDHISNKVAIELMRTEGAYNDIAVRNYERELRAKRNPPMMDPLPGTPFPSYKQTKESPELKKEEPCLIVEPTRIVDLKRDPRAILRGAFRTRVLPEEILKPDYLSPLYLENPRELKPTAIVTVNLLILGSDDGHIASVPLHVPIYGPLAWDPPDGELPLVTGYFHLNLLRLPGISRTPQTYFLYAFSGGLITGPCPYALVSLDEE